MLGMRRHSAVARVGRSDHSVHLSQIIDDMNKLILVSEPCTARMLEPYPSASQPNYGPEDTTSIYIATTDATGQNVHAACAFALMV